MSEKEYVRGKDVRLPEESQKHFDRISKFLDREEFSGVLRILHGTTKRLIESQEIRIHLEELIQSECKNKAPRGNSKRFPARVDQQFIDSFTNLGKELNAKSFSESVKRILRFWDSVLDTEPEEKGPILSKIFARDGKNDLEIWFFF